MGLLGMAASLIGGLVSLRDAVDLIGDAVNTPGAQRELAGSRLHEAIDEIVVSFEAIEAQLVSLLAVDVTAVESRGVLVSLKGGSAGVQLARMRGHCSSMANIWDTDLSTRVQKVFTDATTRQRISDAFGQLGSLDGILLQAAHMLGDGIATEAAFILDQIDTNQLDLARDRLRMIRGEVRDLRQIVNRTLARMTELKFVLRVAA